MTTDSAVLDYYHDEEVKKELHKGIDEFLNDGGDFCDLGRYADANFLVEETAVAKDERGAGYLVSNEDRDAEMIVSLTGVLIEANLPPYRDTKSLFETRPGKKDIPVNRVSIAWFDHDGYAKARHGLENVRTHFSLKYDEIDKLPLPMKCGVPILSCENRIVSRVDTVPSGVLDAQLTKQLDPKGVIRNNLLNSPRNRYVKDNVVTFAELKPAEGEIEDVVGPCSPEEIKVGMIVCVQVTPTVIPTSKGGNKIILKLRNLLRVSDIVYKKHLFLTRVNDIDALPKQGSGLKRSAATPQWTSRKKVAFDMSDVSVRQPAKRAGGGSGTDEIIRGLQNISTEDPQGSFVEGSSNA